VSAVRDLRRVAAARANSPVRRPRSAERCDLCGNEIPAEHRHLLQVVKRQILCACESCFALRSGDAELKPTGRRVVWLETKRAKGHTNKEQIESQAEFADAVKRLGHEYYRIESIDQALEVLR